MQLGTQVLIFLTSLKSREGDYVCVLTFGWQQLSLVTGILMQDIVTFVRYAHGCERGGRVVGGAVQGWCHHTNVDVADSSVVDWSSRSQFYLFYHRLSWRRAAAQLAGRCTLDSPSTPLTVQRPPLAPTQAQSSWKQTSCNQLEICLFCSTLLIWFTWTVLFPRYLATQKQPLKWNILPGTFFTDHCVIV